VATTKHRKEAAPQPKAPKETSPFFNAVSQFRIAAVSVTCCGRELPNDAHLTRLLCILKLAKGRPLSSAETSRLGLALSTNQEEKDGFSAPRSFAAAKKLLESLAPASDSAALLHDKKAHTYSLLDPDKIIQIQKRPQAETPPRPITFFDKPLVFERPEHHKVLETLLKNVGNKVDLNGSIKSRVAPFGNLNPGALYQEVRKIMRMLETLRPPELPSVYLTRDGTVYRLVDRAGDLKFAPQTTASLRSKATTPPPHPPAPDEAGTVFLYGETSFTLDDAELVAILKKFIKRPDTDIDLRGSVRAKKRNSGAPLGASSIRTAVRKISQKIKDAKRPDISSVFIGRSANGNDTTYFFYDPHGHITIAPARPATNTQQAMPVTVPTPGEQS
jgi:hypothetical protein